MDKTKQVILLIILMAIACFAAGFVIGIGWEENSLTYFVESIVFEGTELNLEKGEVQGRGKCADRALILSYYLPFELTENLKVKDCHKIFWLNNKFQELYFQKLLAEKDPYLSPLPSWGAK